LIVFELFGVLLILELLERAFLDAATVVEGKKYSV